MKRIKLNKESLQKAKEDLQLKKKLDFAHRTIHRKSLVHTRRHLTSRLDSVKNLNTRRLLSSWGFKFAAIAVLAGLSYAHLNPNSRYEGFIDGGSVIVGIKDENTKLKLNPLTLSSPAEQAVGRLIYSSLLEYDGSGNLKGDLVSTYSSEDGGKRLRLNLRDGLKWQDGQDLTSEDIVFTITQLKQPRVNSSLRDSLAGVEVAAIDAKTVDISSAKPLAGLDDLLTRIRIAPEHLFEGIEPESLSSVDYNELPVGSGPLEVGSFVTTKDTSTLGIEGAGTFQQLKLNVNKNYYGNQAQADLTFRVFSTKDNLEDAFDGGLVEIFISGENNEALSPGYQELELAVSSGVFSFFNLENVNLKDVRVRRALSGVIDRKLVSELSGGVAPLYSPVLEVPGTAPAILSLDQARALITEAGWQYDGAKSIFVKDGQEFELNLVTGDSEDYVAAARKLAADWRDVGIRVNVAVVKSSELQANYFVNKSYDILLYGISLNQASEPYAYWSSAAATSKGLNFSNYKSAPSDADLDIARTKVNSKERNLRLERFAKRWLEDVPAASLYVPGLRVVYNAKSIQPEPNQSVPVANYADAFAFLKEVKAAKKKIYKTEDY